MANSRGTDRVEGMNTVYIVEDHDIVRRMLEAYVEHTPGVTLVGDAATAEEALPQIVAKRPTLVLVDLALPGMSGVSLIEEIRRRAPEVSCLVISGHAERRYVERALAAGAQGYVVKDSPTEIPVAIRAVLRGERYDGGRRGAVDLESPGELRSTRDDRRAAGG